MRKARIHVCLWLRGSSKILSIRLRCSMCRYNSVGRVWRNKIVHHLLSTWAYRMTNYRERTITCSCVSMKFVDFWSQSWKTWAWVSLLARMLLWTRKMRAFSTHRMMNFHLMVGGSKDHLILRVITCLRLLMKTVDLLRYSKIREAVGYQGVRSLRAKRPKLSMEQS